MRLAQMFRSASTLLRTAALSASSLVGALACSSDCGDAGCVSAVFVDGSIETESQQLIVTACLNQRCSSVELELGAARCATLTLSSDSRICFSDAAPGRLRAALEINSIGDELVFADGDVLALEVSEKASAAVVANVQRTLTYEAVYPNGPDCGGACRGASVTF